MSTQVPSTATLWLTLSSLQHGKAVWNRMDGSEHIGYYQTEHGDFEVVRGDGRRGSDCDDRCPERHAIDPDDFLGQYNTEHEAALAVMEYCAGQVDEVEWQGDPPIHRGNAQHPRTRWFMA